MWFQDIDQPPCYHYLCHLHQEADAEDALVVLGSSHSDWSDRDHHPTVLLRQSHTKLDRRSLLYSHMAVVGSHVCGCLLDVSEVRERLHYEIHWGRDQYGLSRDLYHLPSVLQPVLQLDASGL